MRKILGFYIGKLSKKEAVFLAFVVIFTLAMVFNKNLFDISDSVHGYIKAMILAILILSPIASPVGESLRNIFFLIAWLIICILLFPLYSTPTAYILFFSVAYSQVARIIFSFIYKREPVQLFFHWYPIERFSKIEGRKSNETDFYFSMIASAVGSVLLVLLF